MSEENDFSIEQLKKDIDYQKEELKKIRISISEEENKDDEETILNISTEPDFFTNLNNENIKSVEGRIVFRIDKNNMIDNEIVKNIIINNETFKVKKLNVKCKKQFEKIDGIYDVLLYNKKIEFYFIDTNYVYNSEFKTVNIKINEYINTFIDELIKKVRDNIQLITSLEYRKDYFFTTNNENKYISSNIIKNISSIKLNNKYLYDFSQLPRNGEGNIGICLEGFSIYQLKLKLKINLVLLDIKNCDNKPKKGYDNLF